MTERDYSLGAWLKKAYQSVNMDETATEFEVRNAYRRIVGDLIVKLTWEVRYSNGTLRVKLASAALSQELYSRRDSLRLKINEALGRNAVKQIVFM
ncbi:MAG: DUF721 domain-containing protein [Bacteroidales bacterium]|nr:DUF721 domain-containing protein [Bacteroidales bacterium]